MLRSAEQDCAPAPLAGIPALVMERGHRVEDGACWHLLVWRAGPGWRMVSSAVLGGGLGERAWVLNAQVRPGYDRMDPEQHLADLARAEGLEGAGVGLMTAAPVDDCACAEDGGARVAVTAGIGVPTWAAAPSPADESDGWPTPGTINIVASVPAVLSDAALVNMVATVTEAKVQALLDAGLDCSGTPSDAVCVAAWAPGPGRPVEAFGGPRSTWGSRVARAVYGAVREGADRDRERRAAGIPSRHPLPLAQCTTPRVAGDALQVSRWEAVAPRRG